MNKLESIESAAMQLAISPWTLRAYIRAGKVQPVRIGRRVLLSQEEIERISRGCCASAEPKESQQ